MIRRIAGRDIRKNGPRFAKKSVRPLRLVSTVEIGEGERHFTLRPSLTWTDRIDSLLIRHGRQREREREGVLRSMAYTGQEDRGPFRVNASMCWRSGVTVRKLLAAFVCRGGNSGTVSHCRG